VGIAAGAAALGVLLPLALGACGGGEPPRVVAAPTATAGPSPGPPAAPISLAVTPDDGADGLPISTEIGTEVTGGEITEVTLTAAGGGRVEGDLRADGTSWVPARPLAPSTRYTAEITAVGAAGETTAATSFTTMAAPARRTGTGLYMFDGGEYGVAMPVVVEFVEPVPEEARAGVQRRLFVTTDPPQPGVWHWVPNGSQVFYRAREFWRPGTEISVRVALDGHPTGNGRYGDIDRTATATIGDELIMEIDNAAKQMSVYSGGELLRKMPVSLGKPSTPSSYGTMVVMSKETETVFDTFAELGPDDGYRIDISYAQRLTWQGEFIHAAPWSVADQGVRNVSHGCVNLSWDNAEWLFSRTKVGDPVTVRGTERGLDDGNGWTAWDMTWEEYVEGSALPVPRELLAPPVTGAVPT
jgi:lipoprotein-anchoring transpeptidase ErfK/SrfK